MVSAEYNVTRFDSECFWEVCETLIFGVKNFLVLLPELYCIYGQVRPNQYMKIDRQLYFSTDIWAVDARASGITRM